MKRRSLTPVLCGLLMAGSFSAPLSLQADAQQTAPDNTKQNKQDRNSAQPTADQAKNNMSDLELMRHIRQDVVKDKTLSTYGRNVKIIADHGKVTLRGPVHSDVEKQAINEHAKKYAGDGQVVDELTVKGDAK